MTELTTKFAVVTIMGRPNTGKSTLINSLLNQKISITSPLPQTTRKNIMGLYTDFRGKLLFVDTPGVSGNVDDLVTKSANTEAVGSIKEADILVAVFDVSREKTDEDNRVIGFTRKFEGKKILVFNKIDKAVHGSDHRAEYAFLKEEFDSFVEVSALLSKHLKTLVDMIFDFSKDVGGTEVANFIAGIGLDSGPLISLTSEEYVAEIIREKAFLALRKEVPYSINVVVDAIVEKKEKNVLVVDARIVTTADRYKKMIIGKNGHKVKQIGSHARKELELMSGKKVFLQLEVETNPHWQENLK